MTTLREAAQQALEALEFFKDTAICSADTETASEAITALRAALEADDGMYGAKALTKAYENGWNAAKAEPVQEPVAWMHVPHPDNGLRPVVSLSQQRESSLYGASVPLFIKEQL